MVVGAGGAKLGTGIPEGVAVVVDGATVGGGGIEFDVVAALVLLALGGGGGGGGGGGIVLFTLSFKYKILSRCCCFEA